MRGGGGAAATGTDTVMGAGLGDWVAWVVGAGTEGTADLAAPGTVVSVVEGASDVVAAATAWVAAS